MKLINSTDWSDRFLRRMVAWCCRELEMPVRMVYQARFRNRTTGHFSGHAYHHRGRGRIVVTIQRSEAGFPFVEKRPTDGLKGAGIVRVMADRLEALVNVTAHELRHVQAEQFRERTRGKRKHIGSSEGYTERDAQRVLESFRRDREALLVAWNKPPARAAKPKLTRQQQNEAKARKKLAEWERKYKLAKTKLAQYRAKVRRYDRIAATREASDP